MDCLRGRVKGNAKEGGTIQSASSFHTRPTHQPTPGSVRIDSR